MELISSLVRTLLQLFLPRPHGRDQPLPLFIAIDTRYYSSPLLYTDCVNSSTVSSPHLTDSSLAEYASCTGLSGDLILGHADCASPCTVTSLAPLDNLQSISGLIILGAGCIIIYSYIAAVHSKSTHSSSSCS